jgi:hypothetical protein
MVRVRIYIESNSTTTKSTFKIKMSPLINILSGFISSIVKLLIVCDPKHATMFIFLFQNIKQVFLFIIIVFFLVVIYHHSLKSIYTLQVSILKVQYEHNQSSTATNWSKIRLHEGYNSWNLGKCGYIDVSFKEMRMQLKYSYEFYTFPIW